MKINIIPAVRLINMDRWNPIPIFWKAIVENSDKNPINGYITIAKVIMAMKFSIVCFLGLRTGSIKPE